MHLSRIDTCYRIVSRIPTVISIATSVVIVVVVVVCRPSSSASEEAFREYSSMFDAQQRALRPSSSY